MKQASLTVVVASIIENQEKYTIAIYFVHQESQTQHQIAMSMLSSNALSMFQASQWYSESFSGFTPESVTRNVC